VGGANAAGGRYHTCQIDAAEPVLPLPNRAAVLPAFETDPHPAERPDPPTTSADAPGPDALPEARTDPDRARIAGAWPTLPAPIRRALLALVGTTQPPSFDGARR
jgi:hypothetical protein